MVRIFVLLMFIPLIWAQEESDSLPDREDLVKKIASNDEYVEGTRELLEFFQLGGVRTVFRNLDKLSEERALAFGESFRYLDLFRYRNDFNANLQNDLPGEIKGLNLSLLAATGAKIEPEFFAEYADNESLDLAIRLAAASGMVQLQSPTNYDKFLEIAEDAEYDPATGKNDFRFADISYSNNGFYFYTVSKLFGDDPPHNGHILTAIMMAENESTDLYEQLLELRKKKYIPIMIDRAIQCGGVALLDLMENNKRAKKYRDEIEKAKPAAAAIAKYRDKFLDRASKPQDIAVGALLPTRFNDGGGPEEYPSAYAVIAVDENGSASIAEMFTPFGGSGEAIKSKIEGLRTVPSYKKWKTQPFYYLAVAY